MIWLSIGTSVVAGVFLLLGALQRRGTPAAAGDTAGAGTDTQEQVTAVNVRPRDTDAAPTEAEEAAPAGATSEGEVAVVPGRPRYHVESCRFLAGRPDVETVPVEQARDDGYTACGVCKPDTALAAAAAAPADEPEATEDTMTEEPTAEETTAEPVAEETAAPARKTAAKRTRTAAATGAATAATATVDTPAKPAKKTAAKAAGGTSQVVVIPDRGKYHVETCRFVRDVPGAVNLNKAQAKRQGYVPCGVCKPPA